MVGVLAVTSIAAIVRSDIELTNLWPVAKSASIATRFIELEQSSHILLARISGRTISFKQISFRNCVLELVVLQSREIICSISIDWWVNIDSLSLELVSEWVKFDLEGANLILELTVDLLFLSDTTAFAGKISLKYMALWLLLNESISEHLILLLDPLNHGFLRSYLLDSTVESVWVNLKGFASKVWCFF